MTDSTALMERTEDVLPAAAELKQMAWMAEQFLKSGLLPSSIKTPQQALLIIEKGREIGTKPLYSLSNIHIIDGKPTCSAELLQSLIYRDHGDNAVRITSSTAAECTVRYKRRGWDGFETFTFTMEDAKRAGLTGKKNWQQYPAAMLRARAVSAVSRLAFADSIGGMYTPEELGAEVTISEDGEMGIVPAGTPPAAAAHEWPAEEAADEAEWSEASEPQAPTAHEQAVPQDRPAAADNMERACRQLANARGRGETWQTVMAGMAQVLGLPGRKIHELTVNEMGAIADAARTQVEQLKEQAQSQDEESPTEQTELPF